MDTSKERMFTTGNKRREFAFEYKDETVKLVINTARPVAVVARELGSVELTLGNWVKAYRARQEAGDEALTEEERAELARLRKGYSELKMDRAFLKKAPLFFAWGTIGYVCVAFELTRVARNNFMIKRMARLLEVSRSGFYARLRRKPSGRAVRTGRIEQKEVWFLGDSDRVSGAPKILADLREDGETISRKTVATVMPPLGLQDVCAKRWRTTTVINRADVYPVDAVKRKWNTGALNQVGVGDDRWNPTSRAGEEREHPPPAAGPRSRARATGFARVLRGARRPPFASGRVWLHHRLPHAATISATSSCEHRNRLRSARSSLQAHDHTQHEQHHHRTDGDKG